METQTEYRVVWSDGEVSHTFETMEDAAYRRSDWGNYQMTDLECYGRHAEGCDSGCCARCHLIKGSSVHFRRDHEFHPKPCSCGFTEALAREEEPERMKRAIVAFLAKWALVEPHINGMFSLAQVRSGVSYSGPTIKDELDEFKAITQGVSNVPHTE